MSSDAVAAEQASSAQSNPVGLKQLPIETVHESEQAKRHDEQYVVLISLDGFRHDYIELHNAKYLEAVDLWTLFVQQYIGSHIIMNANATVLL